MIKESLQDKIMFVSHLNEAIQDKFPNVENIAYEVFEYKERGWTEEFAIVYYKGGAIQARNCNIIYPNFRLFVGSDMYRVVKE